MALIPCKECNESVSTEAVACPHCGAPQQQFVPPTLPVQPKEETIYSDNAVTVTTTRAIIGGTTYALRNVTSVKMMFTSPRVVKPILLLIVGVIILFAAFISLNGKTPAPVGVYIISGVMIGGAILWMFMAKTHFHAVLSTSSGELHILTSKDKTYVRRIVESITDAIAQCH